MPEREKMEPTLATEAEIQGEELIQAPRTRKVNWALLLGMLIVVGIGILAFIGPNIAPHDPLQENLIIKVGDQWYVPPFPLFTPGYPLGSDQFGRDLWSRLLWGIKPTLTMVLIVAFVRLILGVIIGLLSGWLENRFGNLLDNLIQGALSIPVLLVALGAIAVIGSEYGIWAFIIGLSLTGWVETAQQVREQTKIIKGQTYIEAARALGSSSRQILGGHILRQITPMLLMLLAFEVSSTLMTTAGLGFLGYYIGGDVWIEVGDFVARRMSGMPELGQMLATSWASLTEPWAMVAVGSTIFVTILGFNLIGEGLRSSLNYVGGRRGVVWRIRDRAGLWLDQYILHPTGQVLRQPVVRITLSIALAAAIFWFGGVQFLWPRVQGLIEQSPEDRPSSALAEAIATATSTPGTTVIVAPEASETEIALPEVTPSILWEYHHAIRFATGAAFDPANEVFYVGAQDYLLLKFDLDGNLLWEAPLPETPFDGVPALDAQGNVYLVDRGGGLAAVSPDGELLWHFVSSSSPNTVSGLTMGPDETLYYVVTDYTNSYVQAVSTSGEDLGTIQSNPTNPRIPTTLSADGLYLFHRNEVIDLSADQRVDYQTELDIIRFLAGRNGTNYAISGTNLLPVALDAGGMLIGEEGYLWGDAFGDASPSDAYVDAQQVMRLLFTTPGGFSTVFWRNVENRDLGRIRVDFSDSSIPISLDTDNILLCGSDAPFSPELLNCAYVDRELDQPLWEIDLGANGPAMAGFVHEDVLYFSTGAGAVYALTQVEESERAAEPTLESEDEAPAAQTAHVPGVAWRYPLQAEIVYGPFESDEGYTYILTEDEMVILNPDGSLSARQEIDFSFLDIGSDNRFSEQIYPFLVENNTLVILQADNSVVGFDEDGQVAWEFMLDNVPDDYPYFIDGLLYIVDSQGILYKVNQDGLDYKFVPEAANRPASGLVVAEDGTVYYSITNRSRGFIQAVSPDGNPLWVTEAHTGSFYQDLYLSHDGSQIYLKEDIYNTSDGSYIPVEYPFQIDQFIPGADGNNYAWSDRSIVQWTLGPNGFEVLNTASLANFLGTQILSVPEFSVNSEGVIWARQFSRAISNWQSVFLTPEGEGLGQFVPDYSGINYDFDPDAYTYKQCRLEDDALSCGVLDMVSGEFVEQRRFEGLSVLGEGYWIPMDGDSLAYYTTDQELYKLDVE